MNQDARSQLERAFDDAGPEGMAGFPAADLVKLVELLKKERDCWMSNAQELQKQNNEINADISRLCEELMHKRAQPA